MAGHSQFKNIMHRKGAQDAKRAKIFTKIIRELTVAIKTGSPDPESNPRLRSALIAARAANMPRDNVERAIKRATGGEDGAIYEEVRYEGYGPGGVAIIVEGLTDNRNRTAPEIRSLFTKHNGALGETNSVGFMFERLGVIRYEAARMSADTVFEQALEAGAHNVESTSELHEVTTLIEDFARVRDALIQSFGDPVSAALEWRAQTPAPVSDLQTAQTLVKLINALEDNDDVQHVFTNADIPDDILNNL
jgi:YebC/PmpR family DNA-binding regulatory protein